jgi:hypothetical protein
VKTKLIHNTLICTALWALGTGMASAQTTTPLSRYLPAGAVAVAEARNLQTGFDASKPLLKSLVESIDPSAANAWDTLELTTPAFFESFGRESSIGLYTVGTKDLQMLAVTRVGTASALLIRAQISNGYGIGATKRVGAFTYRAVDGMYTGIGGGLAYTASSPVLLTAFLERLGGKKVPVLIDSSKYQNTMKTLQNAQLGLYIDFAMLAKVSRHYLSSVFVPRLFDPLIEVANTLGQTGLALDIVADGIEGRLVQTINNDGKDKMLMRSLLASKNEFVSSKYIPADSYSHITCAIDPQADALNTAKWMARFDLFDPTGILMDSQLIDTYLDAANWLGTEASTVNVRALPADSNDIWSAYKNQVWMIEVRDEAAAEAAMKRTLPAFNASLKTALDYYGNQLLPLLDGFGLSDSDQASITTVRNLVSGELTLTHRVKDGFLYIGADSKVLDDFLAAPEKINSNPDFQALPKGGRCIDFTSGNTKLSKADLRKLFEQSAGASADLLPGDVLDSLAGVLESALGQVQGSSGWLRVEGNQIIGQGKFKVTFKK